MKTDIVIFRKWKAKKTSNIIALFPFIVWDKNGNILSYERVGQHGAADYSCVIKATRKALPSEYKALKQELEDRGYSLEVRTKKPKRILCKQ